MKKEEIFKELAAPFMIQAANGKMVPDLNWYTESMKGAKAICVPYIKAEQVISRLNKVLPDGNWSDSYIEMNRESLICELSIKIDGEEITRSGIGVPSNYNKEKGMASDALKRAARKFGIGLYIKNLKNIELDKAAKGSKIYPCTRNKVLLDTAEKLNSYINQLHPQRALLSQIYNVLSGEQQKQNKELFTKIWSLLTEKIDK